MFFSFRDFNLRRLAAVAALLGLAGLSLGGCVGAVVGGGAAVGTAAYQERGVRGVARDIATATRIRTALINAGEQYITGVGIEVYEARVLLTGMIADEGMRAEVVRLVWATEGVKDVLNEIMIGASSLRDFAKDAWVTTQLKSKITFDRDILAINYSIETVDGIVYLIGIAQNQAEVDRIIAHAQGINYVRKIINHVRVKKG
ncbi:MAG: BON domain-containing protein [Rhodospirillales bacterium]|nr:BON domain-containing protein [Rhodospirillales bacterium]